MIRYIWIGILVLVVVTACFGSVRHEILALLIPGDPEITMAAWEELVSRLQTGGGVADAVTAFCRQVLEGAGVAG